MNKFLQKVSVGLFRALDRVGLHVLPKHYYTPVADQGWLRQNKAVWAKRAPMCGVHWDVDEQLAWVDQMCRPYYGEVAGLRAYRDIQETFVGPGYGPIESQILHCVVRSLKPSRIVEIGSGVSTAVMLQAIERNSKEGSARTEMVCIEPYPKPAFRNLAGMTHVEAICQSAPRHHFASLSKGDLFFVDSSHALKTGSDLASIYLDIIPSLAPGVTVHVHDVWLPYLYSPSVLGHYFDWQETPLLLALLTHNPRLKVLSGLAGLQHDRAADLQALLTDFQPRRLENGLDVNGLRTGHYVSSIWLQTC
jgi:hypothetical protein